MAELALAAALPRRIGDKVASVWLSGPHAVCELVSSAGFGARALFVALPVDQAAGLGDRLLGGSGQLGVAARLGALGEVECGVLAYLAAHLAAAAGGALRVRDVFCAEAPQLAALCAEGALWPLRVSLAEPPIAQPATRQVDTGGSARAQDLDVKLLFGSEADCPAERYPLALSIADGLEPAALAALEPGDLLASDSWPLTASSRGLEGCVALSVPGSAERLAATLRGDTLVVSGPLRQPPAAAELRLAELPISFWELAQLAAGDARELPPTALGAPRLLVDGEPRAAGSLMRMRGTVALRVQCLLPRDSI